MLSHCLSPSQSEFGYSKGVSFTKTTGDINLVLAFHHRRQCIQPLVCFWQSEANQGISKLWYNFKGCGFRNTNKPYCVYTHKKITDRDIGPVNLSWFGSTTSNVTFERVKSTTCPWRSGEIQRQQAWRQTLGQIWL